MIPIAFGHRQNVGKDTAATFLCTIIRQNIPGVNVQIAGFADKIKEHTYDLYKWAGLMPGYWYEEEGRHLKNVVLPKLNKTPRQIWITYGNTIRKHIFDGTWAYCLFHNNQADFLIIKDFRFPQSEGVIIKEFKGFLFKIDRPGCEKQTDGADEILENFNDWDLTINNDGTLHQFYYKIESIARDFLKVIP